MVSADEATGYAFWWVPYSTLRLPLPSLNPPPSPLYGVIPVAPVSEYGTGASAIKDAIQAIEEEIKTDDVKLKSIRVVGCDAQHVTVSKTLDDEAQLRFL